MIRSIVTFVIILLTQTVVGQTKGKNDKQEIQGLITTFMECLIKKDSAIFYSLFYTDPVVWAGVTQEKSYAAEFKTDSTAKDNFTANYKAFYRYFYNKSIEEKFYNIQILENGYIASVMFDYSFWEKGRKINWGKESWAMIKANGQWKITSVIFSSDEEIINPEPKTKERKKAK